MDKKLGVFVAKGIMVMALVLLVILTGRVNTQKEEMELLVERVSVLENLVIDINVNRNNIDEIRNTVFDVKEDVSANQEVIDNNKEYINTNQEIIDELSDKIQE